MVLDSLCDIIYNHVHGTDVKTGTKSSKADAISGSIEGIFIKCFTFLFYSPLVSICKALAK